MDREALVLRNQAMAQAFHELSLKHQVRRGLLQTIAAVPIPTLKPKQQRILLIRPDHLGDILLTTPAIQALRHAYPDAEIHALVGPWSAEILGNYPEIDTILTLPFPGFSRRDDKISLRAPYDLALKSARQLRKIGYSSAIVFRPDHWWGAMVAKWAGIPRRIGYDLPDVNGFLTDALPHKHEHVVLQNARLVERLVGEAATQPLTLSFPVNPQERAWVDGYLEEWGISSQQSVIAIHPGSGTWVKQWGAEKWASVADTLAEQLNATIVFTGGDHELPLVRSILSQMRHHACVMVGETRVGSLAALYNRAQLVMGSDSGPLHLAVAVGTPTVTLFGPADPIEFGSWGSPDKHIMLWSNIGCRPCRVLDWGGDAPENHPCVREISVGQVLDAGRRAFAAG